MRQTYVALDIETTGLQPTTSEIIEVAAVKFQGHQVLDTFHSLVNPRQALSPFIQAFTGITVAEVEAAPPFAAIAHQLAAFLQGYPLVGHNISFDLAFLSNQGIEVSGLTYDTLGLARLFQPSLPEYNLASLTRHLGISFPVQHRALPDALATKDVFLALLERVAQFAPGLLGELNRLAPKAKLALEPLLQEFVAAVPAVHQTLEPSGLRREKRVQAAPPLARVDPAELLDEEHLAELLGPDGALARQLPSYEYRREQVQMAQAVTQALNESRHLVVEAGTGVGKSLAYLVPAALYALLNNAPVVVSTNTINLQEQLMSKDIPQTIEVLKATGIGSKATGAAGLRVALVKGRSNYLCLRHWALLHRADELPPEEVRTLIRIAIWLHSTQTGDRAELNLNNREAALWNRICASPQACPLECSPSLQEVCFLLDARRIAESAHVIVVNHALLLADLATGGQILPPYEQLIIDEAHHLEAEATEQLGFRATLRSVLDLLERLGRGDGEAPFPGLLDDARDAIKGSKLEPPVRRDLEILMSSILARLAPAREGALQLFSALARFLVEQVDDQGDYERRLRITPSKRVQPTWSEVENAGDVLGLVLRDLEVRLARLAAALESLSPEPLARQGIIAGELAVLLRSLAETHGHLGQALAEPQSDAIYWLAGGSVSGSITLSSAPLHVGPILERRLFSQKRSAILCGATLSIEGHMGFIKERLGLEYERELLLGTSFDHAASTLVLLAKDLPEPSRASYAEAIHAAITKLCLATRGQALVLFTAHASLRAAYEAIKNPLAVQGINLVAQGIDGSPQQIAATLRDNLRTVALGTASLWEGVDVVGEALSLLVVTKLPFSVPNDPIFAARSELYDAPFDQYAVPQAVLRFKQGFGRLIRSNTDRGAMVVLDPRLHTRRYGQAFLGSLPPCNIVALPTTQIPAAVVEWLGVGGG